MKKIYTLSMIVNKSLRKDLIKWFQPFLKIKRGRKKYIFGAPFFYEKQWRKTKISFLNLNSLHIILNHLTSLNGTFSLNWAYNEALAVKKVLQKDEANISRYLGNLKNDLFNVLVTEWFVIEDKNDLFEIEANNFDLNLDENEEISFSKEDVKDARKDMNINKDLKDVSVQELKKIVKSKGLPVINKDIKNYYVQILVKISSIEKAKNTKLTKVEKEKIAKNLLNFINQFSKDKITFE